MRPYDASSRRCSSPEQSQHRRRYGEREYTDERMPLGVQIQRGQAVLVLRSSNNGRREKGVSRGGNWYLRRDFLSRRELQCFLPFWALFLLNAVPASAQFIISNRASLICRCGLRGGCARKFAKGTPDRDKPQRVTNPLGGRQVFGLIVQR